MGVVFGALETGAAVGVLPEVLLGFSAKPLPEALPADDDGRGGVLSALAEAVIDDGVDVNMLPMIETPLPVTEAADTSLDIAEGLSGVGRVVMDDGSDVIVVSPVDPSAYVVKADLQNK